MCNPHTVIYRGTQVHIPPLLRNRLLMMPNAFVTIMIMYVYALMHVMLKKNNFRMYSSIYR